MPIKFIPHRRAAPVPPPATVTTADDGLSLTGTAARLGQAIGAVGDPAQLLENREIPLAGFGLHMTNAGADWFVVDPTANMFQIGDPASFYGFNIHADNVTGFMTIGSTFRQPMQLDENLVIYQFGDTSLAGNGFLYEVDDNIGLIARGNTNGVTTARMMQLSPPTYQVGDLDSNVNSSVFLIDDFNRLFSYTIGGAANQFFYVDPFNSTYWLGDIPAVVDSTFFYMDSDGFEIDAAGHVHISTATANDRYFFGDVNGAASGALMAIRGTVNQFQIDNTAHNMSVTINGNVGFTGTVAPVNTITVVGGIVTNVA